MLEERKSANMRDREKAAHNHSKMEMIRNNGKVINKIIEISLNFILINSSIDSVLYI